MLVLQRRGGNHGRENILIKLICNLAKFTRDLLLLPRLSGALRVVDFLRRAAAAGESARLPDFATIACSASVGINKLYAPPYRRVSGGGSPEHASAGRVNGRSRFERKVQLLLNSFDKFFHGRQLRTDSFPSPARRA